jgi:uncharacterized protein (DUF1778 family)
VRTIVAQLNEARTIEDMRIALRPARETPYRRVVPQSFLSRRLTDTAIRRIVVIAMKQQALPTARLEARLPHDVMTRLKRAAEIQGRTLTDFVVAAADEAACRAIQETEIIRLSIEGQRQISAAVLNPPAPTPALKRAAKRYRDLFGVA